jgi:hypothetical protein
MLTEALTALGGTVVVGAMATDAWRTTRDGVAGLFSRSEPDRHDIIEAALDQDARLLADTEDFDRERARQELVVVWRRRIVRLLDRHPDTATDLQDLITRVRVALPPDQQAWVEHNITHGGNQFAAGDDTTQINHPGVDSAAGHSIHARTTTSTDAARKGHYDQAWQGLGLTALSKEVDRDPEGAVHSFGHVREFFLRTPCRSLQRALLVIGDPQGNTVAVSIAWVRMFTLSNAEALQRLADTSDTGNISPVPSDLPQLRGVQFTGQHHASRRTGSLVVIAQAAPGRGQPDTDVLDAAAQVAAQFPPP